MTNWRESETRLVLAAVQRFRAFIPNICILVYATSPWKLLAPLSILQCTRTFSFVRAPTIISTQFSLTLFSFLSFFLFSPMLHLNTENYILPDPRRTWNATVFVIVSESLFLLNSPSKSSHFLTFVRRIDRGIVPPRLLFYITKCISSHRQVTFTHFPRVQYVFISSLVPRINIGRSRTFTIPSLSVLFTFIFRFFLDFCFLSFSFFLQADGTHFPSSTFDFSFFFFNRSPPLLLPPLLPFPHSCRWKLHGRRNIKYAVYPCLKSYIYIYIYTFVRYNFSPVSNLLASLFLPFWYSFFTFFPFCFLFFYSITINGNWIIEWNARRRWRW